MTFQDRIAILADLALSSSDWRAFLASLRPSRRFSATVIAEAVETCRVVS